MVATEDQPINQLILPADYAIGITDKGGTEAIELFAMSGQVMRVSADGRRQFYRAAADTDTARGDALIAAMADVQAGDYIFIAPGVYLLSSAISVTVQCTIKGSGYGTVIRRFGNVFTVTGNQCHFENLHIQGKLVFSSADESYVINNWIDGGDNTGSGAVDNALSFLSGCNNFSVINNQIYNADSSGLYALQFNMGQVAHNRFSANGSTGLRLDKSVNPGTDIYFRPTLITSNWYDRNGSYGSYIDECHDFVQQGDSAEKNGDCGLRIDHPINCRVIGCQTERNNQNGGDNTSYGAGLAITLKDQSVVLFGGTEGDICVTGCTFQLEQTAVRIFGGQSDDRYRMLINGNQIGTKTGGGDGVSFGTGAVAIGIHMTGMREEYTLDIKNNTIDCSDNTTRSPEGIRVAGNTTGEDGKSVTIKNNSIRRFNEGINIIDIDGADVLYNKIIDSIDGIKSDGSTIYEHENRFINTTNNFVTANSGLIEGAFQGTLTDGATINWDLAEAQTAFITLAGNRTLAAPTNQIKGKEYKLIVSQDGTGSRTLAFNSVYKFPSGTAPTLSTGANDIDVITFVSDGTNMYGKFEGDFS